MKNIIKLFALIALVVVIGFTMVACDNSSDDPWYVGTWVQVGGSQIMTITETTFSITGGEGPDSGSFSINETNSTSGTMTFGGSTLNGTYPYTRSGNTVTINLWEEYAPTFTKQ